MKNFLPTIAICAAMPLFLGATPVRRSAHEPPIAAPSPSNLSGKWGATMIAHHGSCLFFRNERMRGHGQILQDGKTIVVFCAYEPEGWTAVGVYRRERHNGRDWLIGKRAFTSEGEWWAIRDGKLDGDNVCNDTFVRD